MIYETPIHIVAARRSPIGRFGGSLKNFTALELATRIAETTVPETLRSHIGQVILGQVLSAGCGMNTARQTGLALGILQASPAFTVNMVCGSGLKAVALGADAEWEQSSWPTVANRTSMMLEEGWRTKTTEELLNAMGQSEL